jgi:hypothetical protein
MNKTLNFIDRQYWNFNILFHYFKLRLNNLQQI